LQRVCGTAGFKLSDRPLFCHVEKKTTAVVSHASQNFAKIAAFSQNQILIQTARSVLEGRGQLNLGC
jgi:hypothetical protein